MLNSSVKLAAEMAAAEAVDSGDDSSPERAKAKKASGDPATAKSKKASGGAGVTNPIPGAKKKKTVSKKTVFRNNFVKESDSAT
jgi:hypothetical protein